MYCQYYQAKTNRPKTWFVIGFFKAEDNFAFIRTFDTKESILEFFVPKENEVKFHKLIDYLMKNNYILDFKQLPNRLG